MAGPGASAAQSAPQRAIRAAAAAHRACTSYLSGGYYAHEYAGGGGGGSASASAPGGQGGNGTTSGGGSGGAATAPAAGAEHFAVGQNGSFPGGGGGGGVSRRMRRRQWCQRRDHHHLHAGLLRPRRLVRQRRRFLGHAYEQLRHELGRCGLRLAGPQSELPRQCHAGQFRRVGHGYRDARRSKPRPGRAYVQQLERPATRSPPAAGARCTSTAARRPQR